MDNFLESNKNAKDFLNEKRIREEDREKGFQDFMKSELGIRFDIEDIYVASYDDKVFEYIDEEYLVFTDEEADEAFIESQKNSVDDLGLQGFSSDFQKTILNKYVKDDWFKGFSEEYNENYAYSIENEADDKFENRLVQELYENDLINDNDFEKDDDGSIDYNDYIGNKDANDLADFLTDRIDNYIEYHRFNFGDENFNLVLKENPKLVDWDKVFEEVKNLDGRGPSLASYDGEEKEYVDDDKNTWYIYRRN